MFINYTFLMTVRRNLKIECHIKVNNVFQKETLKQLKNILFAKQKKYYGYMNNTGVDFFFFFCLGAPVPPAG